MRNSLVFYSLFIVLFGTFIFPTKGQVFKNEPTHWALESITHDTTSQSVNGNLPLQLKGAQSSYGYQQKGLFFSKKEDKALLPFENTYTGDFTLAFWLKPEGDNTLLDNGTLFSTQDEKRNTSNTFQLVISGKQKGKNFLKLYYQLENGKNKEYTVLPLKKEQNSPLWTHIAITTKGTTWTIYQNGQIIQTFEQDTATFQQLCFGQILSNAKSFKGHIDEIYWTPSVVDSTIIKQWASVPFQPSINQIQLNVQLKGNHCGQENKGNIILSPTKHVFNAPLPFQYEWKDTPINTSKRHQLSNGGYQVKVTAADGTSRLFQYTIGQEMEWTDSVGIKQINKRIQKDTTVATVAQGWGNAGIASHNAWEEQQNAWLSWTIDTLSWNSAYRIGISPKNEDTHHYSIHYSFEVVEGNAQVWYLNYPLSSIFPLQIGDELKIQKIGTTLFFLHNLDTITTTSLSVAQFQHENIQRNAKVNALNDNTSKTSSLPQNNENFVTTDLHYLADISIYKGTLPHIMMSECRPLKVEAQLKSINCQKQSLGNIRLKVTGGSGKYQYTWQHDPSNVAVQKQLPLGEYTVTIKDIKTNFIKKKTYQIASSIQWIDKENVQEAKEGAVTTEELVKVDSLTYWGVSGAYSSNILSPHENGWIEWNIPSDSLSENTYIIGLTTKKLGLQPYMIDYYMLYENQRLSIYKRQDLKAEIGRIEAGASLRITKEGEWINFYLNQKRIAGLPIHPEVHLRLQALLKKGMIPSITSSFCFGNENPQADSLLTISLPDTIWLPPINQNFPSFDTQGLGMVENITVSSVAQNFPSFDTQGLGMVDNTSSSRTSAYTEGGNYVREITARTSGLPLYTNGKFTDFTTYSASSVSISTQYVDGLGRPLQTVIKQGSPELRDIVQFHVYDAYGREPKQYLPYIPTASATSNNTGTYRGVSTTGANVTTEQASFYNATGVNYATTSAPFTLTGFESSPLNRPLWAAAQGNVWAGAANPQTYATDFAYRPNIKTLNGVTLDGDIVIWLTSTTGASKKEGLELYKAGVYVDGALWVQAVKDETAQNNEALEFTDKLGRVILKRVKKGIENLDTYYIYDDWGNLRFVLPPVATGIVNSMSTTPTTNIFTLGIVPINNLIFRYDYDERNHVILKKVPSAGEVYMVYDKLDRLVLTQDAVQRTSNQWTFTKYDVLNRPVMTGIYTFTGTLATLRTNATNASNLFVRRAFENTSITPLHGYADQTFPTGITEANLLTVSYYDDYNLDGSTNYSADNTALFDATYNTQAGLATTYRPLGYKSGASTPSFTLKGRLTATKVKVLDGASTTQWLQTVTFYDEKGRVLQTQADNHTGGKDILTNRYDFVGNVLKTVLSHKKTATSAEIVIIKSFTYDHANRLLSTTQKIGNGAETTLSTLSYNTLGQLVTKKIGRNAANTAELETIDFRYHIRGWLQNMNDLTNTAYSNRLFRYNLQYEANTNAVLSFTPQYNGNISAAVWRTVTTEKNRAYSYSYDQLQRLTKADYSFRNSNSWMTNSSTENFSAQYSYDNMGNILTLKRNGMLGNGTFSVTGSEIDNLTYSYGTNNLNQLNAVNDAATDNVSPAPDFSDAGSELTSGEYTYNANGSLIGDKNKKITAITYNHLNLPSKIDFGNGNRIENVYDAAGVKLIKRVFENNILKSKTDYLGEFFYEANSETTTLQYIHTAEGRAIPKNDGSYLYEYHYKDHLGNLRLAFGTERTVATMTAETENAVSENAFFNPLNTYRSTQQVRTGTQSAKLAQNQQLETNFIDTRAGNQFLLNLFAFTTTSLTGERISSETVQKDDISFNTPLFTNTLSPDLGERAGLGVLKKPQINLLALLKFLRKKENKSNERTTATYTVRLKVDLYSITKTLISSSVQDFPLTSHSWVSVSPASIAITNTSVAFVKFTLVNPNTFPIFIDDWKIEEKGKVILQENHYDPYGASLFGIEKTGNHEFLYQGKERMEELGLHWDDFEWRNYDITYFRTTTIDPHGESYVNYSPYSWVAGNPIMFIDPDGRDGILYLVNLGVKINAQQIVDIANGFLTKMGLNDNLKIVLWNEKEKGDFNISYLDKNDNVAVIGTDRKQISDFVANNVNEDWEYNMNGGDFPWLTEPNYPENSNRYALIGNATGYNNGVGIVIDHDTDNIAENSPYSKEQGSALSIIHGAGHGTEEITKVGGHLNTGVMMEAGNRATDGNLVHSLKYGKLDNILSISNNSLYIKAIEKRFTSSSKGPQDNYLSNKQRNKTYYRVRQ
jgi:RHS repeat-associated protein